MRARQAGHPRRDEARDEARRDRPTHLGEADTRATPRDRRPAAPVQARQQAGRDDGLFACCTFRLKAAENRAVMQSGVKAGPRCECRK